MFSWAVGISALPLIILYPLAKRFTDWPQIVLGLTFSWAIPVAGAVLWQAGPQPVFGYFMPALFFGSWL